MSSPSENAKKIKLLDISIKMEKERYEETINRASRIDQKIRQLQSRREHILSKSKGGTS